MIRRMDDVRRLWTEEAALTLRVLQAIPDAAMDTCVAPGHRDLRRMAWHLVETLVEMPGHWGIRMEGAHLLKDGAICDPPRSQAEIAAVYERASASLLEGLASWEDADLEREDDLFGTPWQRGAGLLALMSHQTHHRGQMTVLMRQAGVVVPEVYGPTREGWEAYKMELPRV